LRQHQHNFLVQDKRHQKQYPDHFLCHNLILQATLKWPFQDYPHEIGTSSVTSMSSGNSSSPDKSLGKRVSRSSSSDWFSSANLIFLFTIGLIILVSYSNFLSVGIIIFDSFKCDLFICPIVVALSFAIALNSSR